MTGVFPYLSCLPIFTYFDPWQKVLKLGNMTGAFPDLSCLPIFKYFDPWQKVLKLDNMTGAHVSLLQKDDTQAPVPLQEPIHVLFMLAEY